MYRGGKVLGETESHILKSTHLLFFFPPSIPSLSQTLLGWKYEEAFEPTQKYKEGKYILEKTRISKDPDEGW